MANVNTPQAPPGLLSLPPIAVENILRLASFHGAIAACSSRALRDAWRELVGNSPEFTASALVDRFKSVQAAADHIYKTEPDLLGDRVVKRNIAQPTPGLLDAVASPLLAILSALLRKRPPMRTLAYLTATGASDAHALALLRHLWSLQQAAGRPTAPAAVSQTNNNVEGANANPGGPVGNQAQAMRTATPSTPRSVLIGAAFAGHEATVVALLRRVADSVHTMLPAAVRAGNARLCAALLEGGRMAEAAWDWSAAAGGDVLGIRGKPSGFVDSYTGSERAALHMRSIYVQLLPLTYIDAPLAPGGGKGGVRGRGGSGGGRASGGSTGGDDGAASDVGAGHLSGRGLLQRTVGGWNSGGAGQEQSAEEVAAALAAARAAAEQAADTALGDSSPLLPQAVQSSVAAAAVAAAAATAAALAALTQPEASCGGCSSSSGSSGGDGGGAHQRSQACAFLSSTTNHPAVRQLLLQWRPAEWQVVPPPRIRAAALPYAAAVGAWSMVSELLCGGIDPRDTDAPATLLYLALVQGRGAMAAWLLVRLLAHPFGYWNEIAGAAFAAIVTRIIGCISPLQLLLRDNPVSSFEGLLCGMGNKGVVVHIITVVPQVLLSELAAIRVSLAMYGLLHLYNLMRGD